MNRKEENERPEKRCKEMKPEALRQAAKRRLLPSVQLSLRVHNGYVNIISGCVVSSSPAVESSIRVIVAITTQTSVKIITAKQKRRFISNVRFVDTSKRYVKLSAILLLFSKTLLCGNSIVASFMKIIRFVDPVYRMSISSFPS